MDGPLEFEGLDFLYTPSRDVVADMADFVDVLGGRLVFAIDDGGIRVAMIELTDDPPRILLTDHVEGDRPILVYRVADHAAAVEELRSARLDAVPVARDPAGTRARSFRTPGGHRIAVYQLIRPDVLDHFEGRRDF